MISRHFPVKFSIGHCTARIGPDDPLCWVHSMRAYRDCCNQPKNVQYVLVVHASNIRAFDDLMRAGEYGDCEAGWGQFVVLCNRGENTSNAQGVVGANYLMQHGGEILIGNMDDLFPPDGWDFSIWAALNDGSACEVLHVSSGSPSDDSLFLPEIQTRARLERYGYWHHPTYESMWADNEWTECAKRDGWIEARHIVFEHRHPLFGKSAVDAVYQQQNRPAAYSNGQANFEHRKRLGFPRESRRQEVQLAEHRLVIAVCLPGETFHQEWVVSWTNLFGHLAMDRGFGVHMMFAHTSNVYCTRIEITDAVLAFDPRPDLVLWIDDDNTLNKEQFELLYRDLEEHAELDGVVGWCWCDNPGTDPNSPWMMSCGRQGSGGPGEGLAMLRFTEEDFAAAAGPLVPIDWSGFPVVLLRGETLRRLGSAAFQPVVRADVKFGFTSEDTSFFWNARQAGMKFAVDMRVKVPHVKYRAIEPQYVPRPAGGDFDLREKELVQN